MSDLVKLDAPELQVIEQSKAEQIRSTFEPMVKMLAEFEQQYNEVIAESEKGITYDLTARAKRIRLDIGKVRISTEKLRVAQKEEYLRAGKAIDGVSNILKWAVTDKESRLKEIEDHFEIQEKKRLEQLQSERVELISPYLADAEERDLSSMDADVWNAYFSAKKKEYEDRIAAEKKAEEDRIAREKAEAEERERMRQENERLKKEAEEREAMAKKEAEERARIEADRKAKEEAERKANEEKLRKEREAHEAKLKEEREAREKIEAELKAKEEAERKAKEDEEKRIQAELNKGDSAKVKDLVSDLSAIKSKYQFKSEKTNACMLMLER